MSNVNQFKLGNEVNEYFIRGLMKGYQRYLEVRVEAAKELEVSNGYAYTRGNHLEDGIAKEKGLSNVKFEHAKAGSWHYLQFNVHDSDETYLIIVRRFERVEETKKDLKNKPSEEIEKNWLYQLAQTNQLLNLHNLSNGFKTKQLKLFADNREDERAMIKQAHLDVQLDRKFDRFYILSYEIDSITHQIDDASLLMMEPETIDLYEIDTFTSLVAQYQSVFENELLEQAKNVIGKEEVAGEGEEYTVLPAEEREAGDSKEYPVNQNEVNDQREEQE